MMHITIDMLDRLAEDAINGRWRKGTRIDILLIYLGSLTDDMDSIRKAVEDELLGLGCDKGRIYLAKLRDR